MSTPDTPDHEALCVMAETVLRACREAGLMLATAESCTGGLIAACLTEIAGSSDVVDRGFVTYSNAAKNELVDVPLEMINIHGAVSESVARAMAEGALKHSHAGLALAVTGIAGPGGGSAEKPVGLVHFAAAHRAGFTLHSVRHFGDCGRFCVRHKTVAHAFELAFEALRKARAQA